MSTWYKKKSLTSPITLIAAGVIAAFIIGWTGRAYFPALHEQIELIEIEPGFHQSPYYVGTLDLDKKDNGRIPGQIIVHDSELFVSFRNSPEIAVYDQKLKKVRSIKLESNHPINIDALTASSKKLFVANKDIGEIRSYDKQGVLRQAWSWLPDGSTRISPLGVNVHQGILYSTDFRINTLMAISVEEITGVKETGELLYAKPLKPDPNNSSTSAKDLMVTPDGRILIADSESGLISVYSCMGDYYYTFDMGSGPAKMVAPNSIALDNIPSPDLVARTDSIFDPSNVLYQGRVHVSDAEIGRVKVFDNQGQYVLTYGQELGVPEDIAIDTERGLIFISDSEHKNIAIYKYS